MKPKADTSDFNVPAVTPGLNAAEMHSAVLDIHEKRSTPATAKQLLAQFVYEAFHGQQVSRELIVYLRDAIQQHLDQDVPLETALGLSSGRGRGKLATSSSIARALAVLENRMIGLSHEQAIDKAAMSTGSSKTPIENAWRDHRNDALVQITVERRKNGRAVLFDAGERAVLENIFPGCLLWDQSSQADET